MSWISFSEAVKQSGVPIRTCRRRLANLRQLDSWLHRYLVKLPKKRGQASLMKAPEIIAYFESNPTQFKKRIQKLDSLIDKELNKSTSTKHFKKLKKQLDELTKQPVILSIEPTSEEILKSCSTQNEQKRLITTLKICDYFITGFHSLEHCTKKIGIDRKTFLNWRQKSPYLNHLFQKAKEKRALEITDMDIEESTWAIRKRMKGYTVKEARKIFKVVPGYSGKDILIPEKVQIRDRHIPPSLAAAIFMSCNRDPENWKNTR